MRIPCPYCGHRDRREFYYKGAADYLRRPGPDEGLDAVDAYLHLRDNPAGPTRELWHHDGGCGAWLVVTRDTVSHEILGVELAEDAARALREGAA